MHHSCDTVDRRNVFRAIVQQAPDAVIYADCDGAIRIWNSAAEAIFAYAATEIVGKSLDVIIPERLRSSHWAGFNNAIEAGVLRHAGRVLTTRSVHKDGSKLYVDLSFSLVKDRTGVVIGALAIGRNATERYGSRSAERGT